MYNKTISWNDLRLQQVHFEPRSPYESEKEKNGVHSTRRLSGVVLNNIFPIDTVYFLCSRGAYHMQRSFLLLRRPDSDAFSGDT